MNYQWQNDSKFFIDSLGGRTYFSYNEVIDELYVKIYGKFYKINNFLTNYHCNKLLQLEHNGVYIHWPDVYHIINEKLYWKDEYQ